METTNIAYLVTKEGQTYNDQGAMQIYNLIYGNDEDDDNWLAIRSGQDLLNPKLLKDFLIEKPDAIVVISKLSGVYVVEEETEKIITALENSEKNTHEILSDMTPNDYDGEILPDLELEFKGMMIKALTAYCQNEGIAYQARPLGTVFETDIKTPVLAAVNGAGIVVRAIKAEDGISCEPYVTYLWISQWDDGTPDVGIRIKRNYDEFLLPIAICDSLGDDVDLVLSSALRASGACITLSNPDVPNDPTCMEALKLNTQGKDWLVITEDSAPLTIRLAQKLMETDPKKAQEILNTVKNEIETYDEIIKELKEANL